MRQLTFRLLIASFTFAIGIAAFTLWTLRYFSRAEKSAKSVISEPRSNTQGGAIPPDWQKVDMEGKATFYIPPALSPAFTDRQLINRHFRNENSEIWIFYHRAGGGVACMQHGDEKLSKSKTTKMKVAGMDASIENLKSAIFNLFFLNTPEARQRGMIICVPDVGDGEHELEIYGRYNGDQDYQTVWRIINSISFPNPQR
jgi:hypothetical protein